MPSIHSFNPSLDLTFERVIDVPKELVWRAWTEPEHLMPWFCPLPWKTVECEIDLRSGGIFRTVMQSPEGQLFPNIGCILEVIPHERFTWTNALLPDFRPAELASTCGDDQTPFSYTATIALAQHGNGTRYLATVIHANEQGCQHHAAMGFHEGWGRALEQLVEYSKTMPS
jgi:uncharacterized protein YndB with AHSA1/START domain